MDEVAHDIVVCIPTYRRPAQLAALLRMLALQEGDFDFDILIGNNEMGELRNHDELADPALPVFEVIAVAERGVSAVRNAMIALVLARPAIPRWLACIDDDQLPAPDWLKALTDTGEAHDADLVGGPVDRIVPTSTFWSDAASDTSYLPQRTGPTPNLNEGGNLLISTHWLRTLDRPPFSPEFGLSGGEDYEFFLLAKRVGARMVWANEARVKEPLRQDRLNFLGYVARYYTIAAYQTRADRHYMAHGYLLGLILCDVGKGPLLVLKAGILRRSLKSAFLESLRWLAIVAGRMSGIAGINSKKYGRS